MTSSVAGSPLPAGTVRESGRVLVVSDAPGERRAVEGRRAGRVRCRDVQVGHATGPEDPVVFAVTVSSHSLFVGGRLERLAVGACDDHRVAVGVLEPDLAVAGAVTLALGRVAQRGKDDGR